MVAVLSFNSVFTTAEHPASSNFFLSASRLLSVELPGLYVPLDPVVAGSVCSEGVSEDCSNGNHGLCDHIGIIAITIPECALILLSSLKIRAIGGNIYASLQTHLVLRASVASASWNLALARKRLHFFWLWLPLDPALGSLSVCISNGRPIGSGTICWGLGFSCSRCPR